MAWLARSIANPFLPSEEEPDSADPGPSASPGSSPPRGVREDLPELTGTLANRFQSLTSFLVPVPQGGAPSRPNPVEIAGRFRAGLARLPGRQAVADLAKIASSLLPPELDEAERQSASRRRWWPSRGIQPWGPNYGLTSPSSSKPPIPTIST